MGRGKHREQRESWFRRNWELMLIVIPVGAVALVGSIIAATTI